ncbi:MAG TPA: hypothetical protein VNL14_17465 [Candidatus Acidoferrales bacterium]|nr:hypothetical protein [Candidatus Acidoferrales bacterium]
MRHFLQHLLGMDVLLELPQLGIHRQLDTQSFGERARDGDQARDFTLGKQPIALRRCSESRTKRGRQRPAVKQTGYAVLKLSHKSRDRAWHQRCELYASVLGGIQTRSSGSRSWHRRQRIF